MMRDSRTSGERSSGFVGESRVGLVDGLVDLYEDVREQRRSCWVSLEAPSGWGKTRVGRELYARLAATQVVPAYWPAVIEASDRKVVEPREWTRPAGALPEFLWWGISCSTRRGEGLASAALAGDVGRLSEHGTYLQEVTKKKQKRWGVRERFGDGMRAATEEGAGELIGWVGEQVAGAAVPGLGALVRLGRWGAKKAVDKHQVKRDIATPTDFGGSADVEDDIVEHTADAVGRLTGVGFPVVMLVEDIHDADGVLLELLDKLLCRDGSLLLVTTAWPEKIGKDSKVQMLMGEHAGRLRRVGHTAPAGEGFPEGAGLLDLEADARRAILRGYFPEVEDTTEEKLLELYVNPLALELVCELYRTFDDFRDAGELRIPPGELKALPRDVRELYRKLWDELPVEIRVSLAVAQVITPMSINSDTGGGEDRWNRKVLRDVLANLEYRRTEGIRAEEVRDALGRAPDAHTWVRIVDDYLRAFTEEPQKSIADKDGGTLLQESVKDARRQVLTQLAKTLLNSDENTPTHNRARSILALHAEGHITADAIAADAIATLLNDLADNARELPERLRLCEHFTPLDTTDIPRETAFTIRHLGANAHGQAGDPLKAITALDELLEDHLLGDDHPDTLTVRNNRAGWLGESGRLKEAIADYRELLEDCERSLTPDHQLILRTRQDLARWLGESGRLTDAINAHCDVLRSVDTDDPLRIMVRHDIARWVGRSGRAQEAVDKYNELLEDCRRIRGADHSDTLIVRHGLASWLGEAGRMADAIDEFGELLQDRERVLGPDHPHTHNTRHNLGYWLGEYGQVEEAVELYEDLLEDRERISGVDHPRTLIARHNLIRFSVDGGHMTAEAGIAAFRELLEDCERNLDPGHSVPLVTCRSLAQRLGESGRVNEAIAAYQDLLEHRRDVFGSDQHPLTLNARNDLAHWLGESGRVNEAIAAYQDQLEECQRLLGSDHPRTTETCKRLEALRSDRDRSCGSRQAE